MAVKNENGGNDTIDNLKNKIDDLEKKHTESKNAPEEEYAVAEILDDDLFNFTNQQGSANQNVNTPPPKQTVQTKQAQPQQRVVPQPQQKVVQQHRPTTSMQQPQRPQNPQQAVKTVQFDARNLPKPSTSQELIAQWKMQKEYIEFQDAQLQNLARNYEISRRNEQNAVDKLKEIVQNGGTPQSRQELDIIKRNLQAATAQINQDNIKIQKLNEQLGQIMLKLKESNDKEKQAIIYAKEKEKEAKNYEGQFVVLKNQLAKAQENEKQIKSDLQKSLDAEVKIKQEFAEYKKSVIKQDKEQEEMLKKLNAELKKSEGVEEKLKTKLAEVSAKKGVKEGEETEADKAKNEELINALKTTESEMETIKTFAKRIQEDFANFKKRSANLSNEMKVLGMSKVVAELLPVLDNIGFAKGQIQDKDALIGFTMLETQILDALKKFGLKEVKTEDQKFDPNLMSAIQLVDGKAGYVVEELAKGYLLEDTLLRPASVKVGKDG